MGINQDCFEIENIVDGDYHIKFVLKIKEMVFVGPFYLCMGQHKRSTKNFFIRVSMSLY
jgi:hypothetical protein